VQLVHIRSDALNQRYCEAYAVKLA
jgi:hypothetical protein